MKRYKFGYLLLSALLITGCAKETTSAAINKDSDDVETFTEESDAKIDIEEVDGSDETEEEEIVSAEPDYLFDEYDWALNCRGWTRLYYKDGYYYYSEMITEPEWKKNLVRLSDTGEKEILIENADSLTIIDDVIYAYVPTKTMTVIPIDSMEVIPDYTDGVAKYVGPIVSYNDRFILFSYDNDKEDIKYYLTTLYGDPEPQTVIFDNIDGVVLKTCMTEDYLYFATAASFYEGGPSDYLRYDIAGGVTESITEDEMPPEYDYYDSSFNEIKQKANQITGEDVDVETIYHDHLIYEKFYFNDEGRSYRIKIYDSEGNLEEDILADDYGYIGCANGKLLYIYKGEPYFIDLDSSLHSNP